MDADRLFETFRARRRQLEEGIAPYATSVDGRHFTLQSSLHGLAFEAGGYVVLEENGAEPRLGQVLSLDLASTPGPEIVSEDGTRMQMALRAAQGEGVVLAGAGPFHDALARPASPDEVSAHLDATAPHRARLLVGDLGLAAGVPLALDAGGFDRHSFLCGQSGSGKTYALGVVLERLLYETDLRIVVLDPNSDFVRLAETRDGADADAVARHGEVGAGILIRRAGEGPERLGLRAVDIGPELLAAALRLDPIADREEYSVLLDFSAGGVASVDELVEGDSPIAKRARNLGASEWGVWARGEPVSVLNDLFESDARCLVVDLGSLATRDEQRLVSAAVLSALWRERERRQPVLIVMDEAHNICPAEPDDPLSALSSELTVRIAAEGRKFGLYLLISTQRPQKVAENALSQCDNLLLMRMNSRADLAFVGDVFSFVPPGLLARATDFAQGECLVAGKIAPHPAFLRIGQRMTREGGGDVASDWARPS